MVFKYFINISGDNFYPETVLENIQGDFIIDSYFKPTDKKWEDDIEQYEYGHISFMHPKKYATECDIISYEADFYNFIQNNYELFIHNEVTHLEIYMEIYFDGGQCNFEIFNKNSLKQLGTYEIALPISVYILSKTQMEQWEREIKVRWNKS